MELEKIIITSRSAAETERVGRVLARGLRAGDVVALHGELGAGKTQLTRGIVMGLGLDGAQVSSPTFVLMNEYRGASGAATASRVVHVDAYRLLGEDLDEVGIDAAELASAVMVIEWPERVAAWLARQEAGRVVRVELRHEGPDERVLELTLPRSWEEAGPRAARGVIEQLRKMAVDDGRGETVCPITGQRVAADSPTWPFANERAKMADLGKWLSGGYTISREASVEDLEGEGT